MTRGVLLMPSLAGAASTVAALRLARAMDQAWSELAVVCLSTQGPLQSRIQGLDLVDLEALGMARGLGALRRLLSARDPEVVVAVGAPCAGLALAARALGGWGGRIVWWTRHPDDPSETASPTAARAVSLLGSGLHAVVVPTRGRGARLRSGLPSRIGPVRVIPDLVGDASRSNRLPVVPADMGPPLVLSAGRLVEGAGFETLIDAIATVREARPVRLMVAGDGPAWGNLVRYADHQGVSDATVFPGFVHDLPDRMLRAATFVMPGWTVDPPLVLGEARAAGLPVVSVVPPGTADRGAVPMGDADAMAKAIERALSSTRPPAERPEASQIVDRWEAVAGTPVR